MSDPVMEDPNSSEESKDQHGVRSRCTKNQAAVRCVTVENENPAKTSLPINRTTDKTRGLSSKIGDLTVQELATLASLTPDLYREVIRNEANTRRLGWAGLVTYFLGHLFGLAALLMLILVAWHDIDFGHPGQATSIICSGAVSIVAVFVTGKLTKSKLSGSDNDNG
jgi:hypothetical protein